MRTCRRQWMDSREIIIRISWRWHNLWFFFMISKRNTHILLITLLLSSINYLRSNSFYENVILLEMLNCNLSLSSSCGRSEGILNCIWIKKKFNLFLYLQPWSFVVPRFIMKVSLKKYFLQFSNFFKILFIKKATKNIKNMC